MDFEKQDFKKLEYKIRLIVQFLSLVSQSSFSKSGVDFEKPDFKKLDKETRLIVEFLSLVS